MINIHVPLNLAVISVNSLSFSEINENKIQQNLKSTPPQKKNIEKLNPRETESERDSFQYM